MQTQGNIQILDVFTSNQIAAGEVVERPVSVVKELIENAIDAGSKRITIQIAQDETYALIDFIQVSDDGCGMIPADLTTAFYRHATSKIQTIEDLSEIMTLGFRGEALPSIASVSEVHVASRVKDALAGYQAEVIHGVPKLLGEVGMPVGTKITVQHLFYNTPARRKFLKSLSVEIGAVANLVGQMILSHPEIAFVYQADGRTVLHSAGSGDIKQAAYSVYGGQTVSNLTKLQWQNQIQIQGLVSVPPFARANRRYYHFFVNGRLVKSKELAKIVETAYESLLPEKKYPMVILYLTVPPQTIDVNVHPAKTEIRFRQLPEVRDELLAAIHQALIPTAQVLPGLEEAENVEKTEQTDWSEQRQTDHTKKHLGYSYQLPEALEGFFLEDVGRPALGQDTVEFSIPVKKKAGYTASQSSQTEGSFATALFQQMLGQKVAGLEMPTSKQEERLNIPETVDTEADGRRIKIDQQDILQTMLGQDPAQPSKEQDNWAAKLFAGLTGVQPAGETTSTPQIETEQPRLFTESENIFTRLRPLGQLNASFIIAVAAENLYIIDQHAAHERIMYESFQQRYAETSAEDVAMLALPTTIELGNLQKEYLLQHINEMHDFGFVVEHLGDSTFVIRGVPLWFQEGQISEKKHKSAHYQDSVEEFFVMVLDQMVEYGKESGNAQGKQTMQKEELFSMACRSAIKANQTLQQGDIAWLLQALSKAKKPLTCPHGRPTIIKISEAEIRKRFLRG